VTAVLDNYKIELFQITSQSLAAANKLQTFEAKVNFGHGVNDLISDESSRYWHAAELLNSNGFCAAVKQEKNRCSLVFTHKGENAGSVTDPLFAYGIEQEECKIRLGDPRRITLSPLEHEMDFLICKRLMLEHIRGFASSRYDQGYGHVVDLERQIDSDIPRKSAFLEGIRAYRGVDFQFLRLADASMFFMGSTPRSSIRHHENLDSLLRSKGLRPSKVSSSFPYVRMPWGGTGKVLEILQNRFAGDPVKEDPVLAGRSFIEFAEQFYARLNLKKKDSPLAIVGTSRGPRLYSCEALYPSVNFEALDSEDPQYFSRLISRLRLISAKERLEQAIEWTRILKPMMIMSTDFGFEVDTTPFELSALSKVLDTDVISSEFDTPGGIFERPPMSFSRVGSSGAMDKFTVYPGKTPRYQGTLNDLLDNPELKPFDAPSTANVIEFVHQSLVEKWTSLKEAVVKGVGGYRGLKPTFGIDVSFKQETVTDFLGLGFEERVANLRDREYDCAICVVPRFMDSSEDTRKIYTEPKTAIMRKGIPVQVIANDERRTESRDRSLVGRSRSSTAVFGLACNLLAKIGAILTALGADFADSMLEDSAIMGYDVARVFPQIKEPMKLVEQKRTSIPLAAPLFIFDNRGARIVHQHVYRPSKENLLFEEKGSEIFSSIGEVSNLIIHKDGSFSGQELQQVKRLAASGTPTTLKKVIPISIVKSDVPRIFRPDYGGAGFELRGGTFLCLSPVEFVLATTPTYNWVEEKRGWPCPIWIQIHDREMGHSLAMSEKFKLLYQIFALTKMHTGSQLPTKSPVSIHYSNMVARFLRKVGESAPDFLDKLIEPRPERRFVPRWYL